MVSKSKIDCLGIVTLLIINHLIPVSKCGDTFTMFGNFCSAECAAAYNFDSKISNDEMWERYSLLNMLYSQGKEIKAALPRLSLKKFGGPFTISGERIIQVRILRLLCHLYWQLFLHLKKLPIVIIVYLV